MLNLADSHCLIVALQAFLNVANDKKLRYCVHVFFEKFTLG